METDKAIGLEQKAWDMALTIANNLCVQISDKYNNDDDIEQASVATECAKTIRDYIGQYPESWQQNQHKQVVDEKFLLNLIDLTWNHCTESKEVPSTNWAKVILKEAGWQPLPPPPKAPIH